MFDRLANGKDVLSRTDITNPWQQQSFDTIARSLNVTNGQLTRQQYIDGLQQMMQQWRGGGRGGAGAGGAGPRAGRGPGGGGPGGNPDAMAESAFKQLDKNGDGFLSYDEMTDELKAERDKWDTDKNGLIDLNEYKAYFRARMQQIRADNGWGQNPGGAGGGDQQLLPPQLVPDQPDDPKRVVYRVGKLPPELPAWFAQIDTDKDGQIGLYEWKSSGRQLDEFFAMDANGDGFLTPEEVLGYLKKANGGAQAANGAPTGGQGVFGQGSQGQGRGGFGRGQGGFNRGGGNRGGGQGNRGGGQGRQRRGGQNWGGQ
jgi:Ca2+-binding EF-hand superfamily protein